MRGGGGRAKSTPRPAALGRGEAERYGAARVRPQHTQIVGSVGRTEVQSATPPPVHQTANATPTRPVPSRQPRERHRRPTDHRQRTVCRQCHEPAASRSDEPMPPVVAAFFVHAATQTILLGRRRHARWLVRVLLELLCVAYAFGTNSVLSARRLAARRTGGAGAVLWV